MVTVEVLKGDITEVSADAIVNPANSLLIMGGGVAGAIKRKGGEEIERDAVKKAPIPVGDAIITKGYRLKASYVIHAPTMERPAMRINKEKAIKAILAALIKAEENRLKSIAFPGMGTGVGGLSAREGADAFVDAVRRFIEKRGKFKSIEKIILVAFEDELYREFQRVKRTLESILESSNI